MTSSFSHFVGIDWSGAKGKRHAGIAVALCNQGQGAPTVVAPPSGRSNWSRQECTDWILRGCGLPSGTRVLIGIDSSFSMPFMDKGMYLTETFGVSQVKALWKSVESHCEQGVDLYGGGFVSAHSAHYLRTGERGTMYQRRMRVTETRAVDSGAGPCESVFHLIGPSQVGLSGVSTMRMLAHLDEAEGVAVWPYDPIDKAPVVLTEIYAAAFASLGYHKGKVRDIHALNAILARLGSKRFRLHSRVFSDHLADALVTAAALRTLAPQRKYWHPELLSSKVRETEGWVFGIL